MPETSICDQFSLMSDRYCRAGKGPLPDSGPHDIKGAVKLFVLPFKRIGQNVVDTLVQRMSSYCFCFRFITHSVQR